MRNLKRFLAMALTVLMVVGSFSAMSVSAFEDVTDYQEAIDVMAALGILKGTDEEADLFSPEENIARWQMALIITKMMTGKVDAAYVEANFNTSINSTLYTDLNEGQYMGATAYAANNGIVVGTSATTYEPEAEIMIQDVFTMVVRMLGYGSTAMNANYPWSFIDKAISLGLDAGLPADYANEKAATRGETAQILYNALTAVKADGSTLGYDFFGLEKATVIITGTKDGNMFTDAKAISKTADGVDYVAFNVLNADGTIAATTYYAPKSAFGIEGNANAYVGYPFVVRTVDAFANFMTVEPIEAVVVDQDAVVGAAAASGKGVITIDGTAYTLKETFSDFIADNNAEIILYQTGNYASTIDYGSYVMNEDLDILGKDGKVLLEWHEIGNVNGAAFQNGTYLYKVADGKYIVPNDAIWAQAATYVTGTNKYGFKAILDSYTLETKDAYSDTVLFDLDGDGDYEYGFYTQYAFKKIADDKTIDTAKKASELTFVTADGAAAKYADYAGKYVLYAFNDLYNTVIVKAVYTTSTALVTGADLAASKITFNGFGVDFINGAIVGETLTLGNSKLAGSVVSTAAGNYFAEIIGKNVVYVEDNGVVLAIEQYADPAEYMVVTNPHVGFTTMGYEQMLGYSSVDAQLKVITVNARNNYWYGNINNAVAGLDYVYGDLVSLKKDALGNYDIAKVEANYVGFDGFGLVDDEDLEEFDATIEIVNGIAFSEEIVKIEEDFDPKDAEYFPTFVVDSDFVWMVGNGREIQTYIGAPKGDAKVIANGPIFYDAAKEFIYIPFGELVLDAEGSYNPWGNTPVASTFVYIDAKAAKTMKATNVYGNSNIIGMTYTYSGAFDMLTGNFLDVSYTDYTFNARLQAGKFYKVEGGMVVAEVEDEIQEALLLAGKKTAPDFFYAWIDQYDADDEYYFDLDKDGEYVEANGLDVVPNALAKLFTVGADGNIVTKDGKAVDSLENATLNDVLTDGKDSAYVVNYVYGNAANKPVFLAIDTTAVEVAQIPAYTEISFNEDSENNDADTILYAVYAGKEEKDIKAENFVGVITDEEALDLVAGNYILAVIYNNAATEANEYKSVTLTLSDTYTYNDIYTFPATFTKTVTLTLAAKTAWTYTVAINGGFDKVDFYTFAITAAMADAEFEFAVDNYTNAEKADDDKDKEDAKKDTETVNVATTFNVVWDSAVEDKSGNRNEIVKVAYQNAEKTDYVDLTANASAVSSEVLTMGDKTGRVIRLAVKDGYSVEVSYNNTGAGTVDKGITITKTETENVAGQVNYVYFTINSTYADAEDTLDVYIEINK